MGLRQDEPLLTYQCSLERTVVTLDYRGVGESNTTNILVAIEDLAADCISLLKHLKWPHCYVLGTGFGAAVAGIITIII